MWYDDNMEQNYLTREAEQEAAFLSKIARYRGDSHSTSEALINKNNDSLQIVVPENGRALFTIMLIAIVALWTNSFFFPQYSILVGVLLLPIFRLTSKISNWRYGAYFILSLAFVISSASLAKIMGAAF